MLCNTASVLRERERVTGMVWWYNICNPSTWKSEIGKSQVSGQHELQSKILPTPKRERKVGERRGEDKDIKHTSSSLIKKQVCNVV